MKILKTKFEDLLIYQKDTFKDSRGYFRELYLQKHFKNKFPFDVMSYSKKNVLRGLHLQTTKSQAKLITVLNGEIYDVCVDCRTNSKTFGKYFSIKLSADENKSILIPSGFAHGFCSLASNTILHYKCTNYRDQKSEIGIIWNDKNLKIKWPIDKPIISKKDKINLKFKDFIDSKKFMNLKW